MDINEKLRHMLKSRGWTTYRLAKKCGLSHATIDNIFRRGTVPSFTTLEAICRGFGISLSQFFAEGEMIELTPELKELFSAWEVMTKRQKAALLELMRAASEQ